MKKKYLRRGVPNREKSGIKADNPVALKGSMTVEAAFVVPIVVFGTVALIFLVIFMYRQISLDVSTDIELERQREFFEQGNESSQSSITEVVGMPLPEKGILGKMIAPLRSIRVTRDTEVTDRTKIMRRIDTIIRLIKGGE